MNFTPIIASSSVFSTAFILIATASNAGEVPLRYECENGSRVSINESTGEMTITSARKQITKLPFAGYMSSHGGFGKYTECYVEDAPCAEIILKKPNAVYITPDAQNEGIKCDPVK